MNAADNKSWPAINRVLITEWDWTHSTHHEPRTNGHPLPVPYCGPNESVAMIVPYHSISYEWPIFMIDMPHARPVDLNTVVMWGYEFNKGFTGCDGEVTPSNFPNVGFEFILTVSALYVRPADELETIMAYPTNPDWQEEFLALNGVTETAWTTMPELLDAQKHNNASCDLSSGQISFAINALIAGDPNPVALLQSDIFGVGGGNVTVSVPTTTMVIGMGEPPVTLKAIPGTNRGNCWRPKLISCGLDS